jgi:hypothetical protein
LFQVRKQHGAAQTVADVKRTWREASSLILKKLKG